MVRHTHQDFLLGGKGRDVPLPLPISMDEAELASIRDFGIPKDLFDFGPSGHVRKLTFSKLDRDIDSTSDWERVMASIKDTDRVLLVDDRSPSGNPIVNDFDIFTKQRYLAALAAEGICAAIIEKSD